MSTKMLKPLLVFGLRGTLLERIHVRQIPPEMPIPDLTVGMFKVWLRPNILTTLLELQKHCNLAIWSSTTARNTFPLVDAVFNNQMFLEEHQIIKPPQQTEEAKKDSSKENKEQEQQEQQQKEQHKTELAENKLKSKTSRLTKRKTHDASTTTSSVKEQSAEHTSNKGDSDVNNNSKGTNSPNYIDSDGRFISPFKFEFVWTREHTSPDYFRRAIINVKEDEHATLKDLSRVYSHFPEIATPLNTVLIDDTPSKARRNADNMLWLDTCEQLAIRDDVALTKLVEYIKSNILTVNDVREILPVRVRLGESASKLSTASSGWTIERK